MRKIKESDFLVKGYLLSFATGEYSDRSETIYLFRELPDMEKLTASIRAAWEKDEGGYRGKLTDVIQGLIEELGAIAIPIFASIWTDDYGTSETNIHNNLTGTEIDFPHKLEK